MERCRRASVHMAEITTLWRSPAVWQYAGRGAVLSTWWQLFDRVGQMLRSQALTTELSLAPAMNLSRCTNNTANQRATELENIVSTLKLQVNERDSQLIPSLLMYCDECGHPVHQQRCTQVVKNQNGTIMCGIMMWDGQQSTFQLLSKQQHWTTLPECQMKQMPRRS